MISFGYTRAFVLVISLLLLCSPPPVRLKADTTEIVQPVHLRADTPAAVVSGFSRTRLNAAESVSIKLATIAADGSIWHKALRQMASDWSQGTQGRVSLVVFSGGTQGDEPTMVRKMRFNQLQAAALTAIGLGGIESAFDVFSTPFLFGSYEELIHVVDRLTPTLQQRLVAKGFHLLHWGHAGWVQVFTKRPVRTMAELKQVNVFTSAGDDQMVQWYKANGFQPVALALTDIMTGLQTGMIDAVPTTPLAALSFQWYRQTPYMVDVGLAPLVGATVITAKAWNAIDEADRQKVIEAGARAEKFLETEVPKQDAVAIAEMRKRGLTVTKIEGNAAAEFRAIADKLTQTQRGSKVPAEIFDLAVRERNEFRQRRSGAGGAPAALESGAHPKRGAR